MAAKVAEKRSSNEVIATDHLGLSPATILIEGLLGTAMKRRSRRC